MPVLDGALRQVDLLRPQDPIGFIALYCLKYKERLENWNSLLFYLPNDFINQL